MVVGFYVHTDMNFVVTERNSSIEKEEKTVSDAFALDSAI